MRKRNPSTAQVHPTRLPALDLLVGFESAARTVLYQGGEELFLTQSAVSRQIKELRSSSASGSSSGGTARSR